MFSMNINALQSELTEWAEINRAMQACEQELENTCAVLPQVLSAPELCGQLKRQRQDLLHEMEQAQQLYRAMEQITQRVVQTETKLTQQPDSLHLTFWAPAAVQLKLENQTSGIRITW